MSTDKTDGLTIIMCPPTHGCDHVFDGPEVQIYNLAGQWKGSSTTCSKCGARAIDVDLWLLP